MALLTLPRGCFVRSGTSASRLPDQSSINAVLPFIGLDNVALVDSRLHFRKPGMELDFGRLGKEYAADRAAEVCVDLGARHGFVDLGGDIRRKFG